MYRGYFNTREGKELVAIKTCKRMFYACIRVKQMLKDIGMISGNKIDPLRDIHIS